MPSETLDRCTCDGIEIGTHAAAVVVATPEHMRGRHYGCYTMRDTLAIDACVLPEIAFLWRLGIVTTGSCCGHNQQPGYIGVAREDVPRMEALGYQHSVKHTGEPHPEAFLPRWTLREPLLEAVEWGERWQPIETAPKDVEVLVYHAPDDARHVAVFDSERYCWIEGNYYDRSSAPELLWPTHWMPLPQAPTAPGAPEEGAGDAE